jgi:L-lactate utilization protein LutC
MNTCPVYRRSGGHSYGSTVPGPIGSVLTPGLDLEKYAALPFASTLCGSCTAVCPVKIDLDAQLYRWRQLVADAGHVARGKATAMRAVGKVLARPRWFRFAGALVRGGLRAMPQRVARLVGGAWGATRELPPLPAKSFRAWYRANHPNTSAIPADMRGDVSTGRHPTEEQRPASARREQGNTASVHTSSRASRDPADGRDRHRARDGQVARNPRDAIMRAVRAARPAPAPLPDVIVPNATQRGAAASELADAYATAARSAGADVVLGAWRNIAALVADVIADATRVASMVPEVPGTVEIADDPHAYAELDAFVARGTLGVGENGAVWLPASVLGQRAGLFLATRVVLLLDRDALVPDFHAAYARLDVAAEPFGVFVAGPSKTADIEQSLVVGAHGPKALTILLLDNAS